jgi:enoyl-CoA hydratase/carnithine racemase
MEERMDFVELQRSEGIATVMLRRSKVNALNGAVVDQLREVLNALEGDPEVKAIVLTGAGKFFSFGFDIPEFL